MLHNRSNCKEIEKFKIVFTEGDEEEDDGIEEKY